VLYLPRDHTHMQYFAIVHECKRCFNWLYQRIWSAISGKILNGEIFKTLLAQFTYCMKPYKMKGLKCAIIVMSWNKVNLEIEIKSASTERTQVLPCR